MQDNPSHVFRGPDSRIAGLIANSSIVLALIDNEISTSTNGFFMSPPGKSLEFTSGELFYGLQKVGISYTGVLQDCGDWLISGIITDRFDFDNFRTITKNGLIPDINVNLGNVANDLALISQNTGALSPFDITINFRIRR